MEDFLAVGRWLIDYFIQLWNFLGTAGFLGFAVIGMFVLRKIAYLFKKVLTI